MSSRGHPGYWLVFGAGAGATVGVLVLLGVDEPARRPWVLVPAIAGFAAAELIATGLLGWQGPDDVEQSSGRASGLALAGIPLALVAVTGSLVLYGLTDSPVAAWAAVLALLATGGSAWAAGRS